MYAIISRMQSSVASTQEVAQGLQALWHLIGRTASGEFFRVVAESELSLSQLKALYALTDESLSVKQLAAALHISEAATSRAADGLVRRGLLERRECQDDRRSRRMHLTPAGAEVRDRTMQARLAGLVEFVERLTPAERASLDAALSPIVERLAS